MAAAIDVLGSAAAAGEDRQESDHARQKAPGRRWRSDRGSFRGVHVRRLARWEGVPGSHIMRHRRSLAAQR